MKRKHEIIDRGRLLPSILACFSAALLVPFTAAAETVVTAPAPATQPAPSVPLLPWLTRLADAIDQGQKARQPILVDVGAEWCTWCRELDKQVALPEVQAKLARWTRLRLDADRDTEAARALSVGPIPALRLLSPEGRIVASQDGYLPGKDLISWLDEHYQQAAGTPGAALDELAGAADVDALLPKLTDGDAIVREAATRRLIRRPDLAARKIVDVFASGKLSVRLSTLELLQEWKAPTSGLDPWDPPTVSTERIEALKKWAVAAAIPPPATGPAAGPTTAPVGLTPEDLVEARRDMAAMLQAGTEPEVLAARERLARFGPALLPEVYSALKAAGADRDRERLTALRYRLVASETLALNWPGGMERLASSDAAVRHAALDEVGAKVTAQDAPLLSELFSDPDQFIRESSLRLLQAAGDASATSGLVRLLHDPEPNVRAAVLKQLAETPMPGMDKEIVQFVATEKDPDLLVHAVRVLREAKTKAAIDCLMTLLVNPSWRVRAEAAEGLGKNAEGYTNDQKTMERKADIYAAMIKLLDDSDGYVVGRAVLVLRGADVEAALEPMVKAAEKRPELAGDVVRALERNTSHPSAIRYMRKFCSNPDPSVRAAAIAGLCQSAPGDDQAELQATLTDVDANVRMAAAAGLLQTLDSFRPNADRNSSLGDRTLTLDAETWLTLFRSGAQRPQWLGALVPPLEKMLASPSLDEAMAAAVPLVAMGRDNKALPLLRKAIAGPIGQRQRAIDALPWLPWDLRATIFNDLAKTAGRAEFSRLVQAMVVVPNLNAADPLWALAANPVADITVAASVESSLSNLYLGSSRNYVNGQVQVDPIKLKVLLAKSSEMAASGTEMQRLIALALLVAAPNDASAAAAKIIEDKSASPDLRRDAYQVALLSKPQAEGEKMAVACLAVPGGADWEAKKLAVRFLALGGNSLSLLRNSIYLSVSGSSRFDNISGVHAVDLSPPQGLTAAMVKPMVSDSDKLAAACAGYFLALLGDRSGLDTLLAVWRENASRYDEWQPLVYRAVAALNDDSLVPVLEEVYKTMGENARYNARPFYWTIRGMKGPNILKLRKKVRDEVGMSNLQ